MRAVKMLLNAFVNIGLDIAAGLFVILLLILDLVAFGSLIYMFSKIFMIFPQ